MMDVGYNLLINAPLWNITHPQTTPSNIINWEWPGDEANTHYMQNLPGQLS